MIYDQRLPLLLWVIYKNIIYRSMATIKMVKLN